MTTSAQTLTFRFVNAYLVRAGDGFVLIDTGFRSDRNALDQALVDAGCGPGDLKLIIITHGDPDHAANAVYLRDVFGAKIAMHRLDVPAVEKGDMYLCRGRMPFSRRILKPIIFLFRLRRRDRFSPDICLEDGDRLTEYGLEATVLHLPGHSKGSIAVLTDDGDFFSGDFLENRRNPAPATLADDCDALRASFERVKHLNPQTVYPGHGAAFPFSEIGEP